MKPRASFFAALALLLCFSPTSHADQFNLTISQYGTWWMYAASFMGSGNAGSFYGANFLESGIHGSYPNGTSPSYYSNYFVLDLTSITAPISSVSVSLPGFTD